jgi:integrase
MFSMTQPIFSDHVTYLGARRKEFASLALDDIAEDDNGLVIILRTNESRGLKTEQSERVLPVPDELFRLAFVDYCIALKGLGSNAVFPDLISDKSLNDPGDRFYDVFSPMMNQSLGEKMWKEGLSRPSPWHDALTKYLIVTAGIERKPIKLLPGIQNLEPPPWAREANN